jgi:hypothetical protein
MIMILAVLIISTFIVCFVYGMKELHEQEQRQIEREEKFEKWLFEALYSIDQKVLLPPEKERIADEETKEEITGTVYRPSQDPIAVYNGQGADYYE